MGNETGQIDAEHQFEDAKIQIAQLRERCSFLESHLNRSENEAELLESQLAKARAGLESIAKPALGGKQQQWEARQILAELDEGEAKKP